MTGLEELLRAWGASDWDEIARTLGYPSTSPSFRWLGAVDDTPDPWEVMPAEVQAVIEALDWLARLHPDEYMALARRYRPWVHGQPTAKDRPLLDVAKTRLASRIGSSL